MNKSDIKIGQWISLNKLLRIIGLNKASSFMNCLDDALIRRLDNKNIILDDIKNIDSEGFIVYKDQSRSFKRRFDSQNLLRKIEIYVSMDVYRKIFAYTFGDSK